MIRKAGNFDEGVLFISYCFGLRSRTAFCEELNEITQLVHRLPSVFRVERRIHCVALLLGQIGVQAIG
jgi:hypothetical protein